jgi:hypothetical protein
MVFDVQVKNGSPATFLKSNGSAFFGLFASFQASIKYIS